MTTLNTILCAIDFSEPARAAMELAADVARRYQARLTLVHVHEPLAVVGPDLYGAAPELRGSELPDRHATLERWRAEAERLAGRSVQAALLSGSPSDEIVDYARHHRIDLVVVGTHGRTGLTRLVLGSVAEGVVRKAPCPVLVARPPEGFDDD